MSDDFLSYDKRGSLLEGRGSWGYPIARKACSIKYRDKTAGKENSRAIFAYLQSQKNKKQSDKRKKSSYQLLRCYILIRKQYNLLLLLLADLKQPSIRTTHSVGLISFN